MKIAGLFAGIGGIELGFHQALGDGSDGASLRVVGASPGRPGSQVPRRGVAPRR